MIGNLFGKKNKSVDIKSNKKDDIDDDFDMSEFETDEFDDNRKPGHSNYSSKDIVTDAKEFSKILATKTSSKILPDEYSYSYNQAIDFKDFSKDIITTNKIKIQRELGRLNTEVKKIVPAKLKGVFDKIGNFLNIDDEQSAVPNIEAQRESTIGSNLDSIFNKQLKTQAILQADSEAKAEINLKSSMSQTKRTQDILIDIANSTSNQTSFTVQIAKEYYKKSLELQYKSFFIQSDMLEVQRNYFKTFTSQFDLISKNTALPEYSKLQAAERLGQLTKDRVISNILDKTMQKDGYVDTIKKNFSNFVTNKTNSITDSISQVTSGIGMINEVGNMSSGNPIVSILKGLGMDLIAEKISDKIGDNYKGAVSNSKYIKSGKNLLGNFFNSPQSFFSNVSGYLNKKIKDNDAVPEFIKDGANDFFNIFKPKGIDRIVQNNSILDATKPAIFDNKVYRSITDTIPLYLSKILLENTNLTRMYKGVNKNKIKDIQLDTDEDSLHYDFNNRTLNKISTIKENVHTDLRNKADVNKTDRAIDSIGTRLGLSTEESETFKKYINKAKDTLDSKDFNADVLLNIDGKGAGKIDKLLKDENGDKIVKILKKINTDNKTKKNLNKHKQYINYDIETILDKDNLKAITTAFNSILNIINDNENTFVKDDKIMYKIVDAIKKYIIGDRGVLTPDNVLTPSYILAYLDENTSEYIAFLNLMSAVKEIQESGGMHNKLYMQNLLGTIDTSIRDNNIIDSKILKQIYEHDRRLIDVDKKNGITKISLNEFTEVSKTEKNTNLNVKITKTGNGINSDSDNSILDNKIEAVKSKVNLSVNKISNIVDEVKKGNINKAIKELGSLAAEFKKSSTDILSKIKNSSIEGLTSVMNEASSTIKNTLDETKAKLETEQNNLINELNSNKEGIDKRVIEGKLSMVKAEISAINASTVAFRKTMKGVKNKIVDIKTEYNDYKSKKEEEGLDSIKKELKENFDKKVSILINDITNYFTNFTTVLNNKADDLIKTKDDLDNLNKPI